MCSPWARKESHMTELLSCTELDLILGRLELVDFIFFRIDVYKV